MAEDVSTKHITKFDGTNFQMWKFQMRAMFTAYGVRDVVSGEIKCPEDKASAEYKKWEKDDAKAMFLISTSMHANQLEYLLTCENACEMWKKLSNIHEQTSATSKLLLMQKFHEYKMAPNDSVVQHIAKIQNIARQLKDVGETISEVATMAKILGSLPPKFNALVTAWDSVASADQTTENLQQRLIKEERRLEVEDEASSALAAMTINKNNESHQKSKSVECFYCKKKGHMARNCRKKKYNKQQQERGKGNEGQPSTSPASAFVVTETDQNVRKSGSVGPKQKLASAEQISELLSKDISEVWITDSGASRHITYRQEWFSELRECKNGSVSLGDNGLCEIEGVGTIQIKKLVGGVWEKGSIENVLYVPKLRKNLFSVGVCTARKFEVNFKENWVSIHHGDKVVAQGMKQDNEVYRMFFVTVPRCEANVSNLQKWHERLGHVSKKTILEMVSKDLVQGVSISGTEEIFCEACQYGKSHRQPFKTKLKPRDLQPGDYIHSDVCGPMSVDSVGGARYFVTFKDDVSDFRQVYFLKNKCDVIEYFKKFQQTTSNKFGRSIKVLRTDRGTEYCNREMTTFLGSQGIIHEVTAPYTPQQNGKSERENRTIVESARSMLHAKKLPHYLWAEAVNTAVYILNRTQSKQTKGVTPYEIWMKKKPCLSHIRVFGSDAYMHVPHQLRRKLDAKAKKLILVGYQGESTNYRLFNPETKRVVEARDVVFNEQSTSVADTDPNIVLDILKTSEDENRAENENIEQPDNNIPEVENDIPTNLPEHDHQLRDRKMLKRPARFEANFVECSDPVTFQGAITGENAEHWKCAIQEELQAHEKNKTWVIVRREEQQEVISSKWVFKTQCTSSGAVSRYKARLCARGFQQKYGLDYLETFSPVVRYDSLRVLLAVITQQDLELLQFDIRTAFLYGKLEEDIYMAIPEGVDKGEHENEMVCKLQKSLYGLKQSPRCWNKMFTTFLNNHNFKQCDADACFFVGNVKDCIVYLALFVDDGLLAAKTQEALDTVIQSLKAAFEVKVINSNSTFCGVQIERDRKNGSMFIHQSEYLSKVLQRFHMNDANSVCVPADPNTHLREAENDDGTGTGVPYREAVGSLMFLATNTRPDIAFAVNQVSRYVNNFTQNHWQAVKRIFRYLKGTNTVGIQYSSSESFSKLIGYCDSDFASDQDTRRSVTGFIFMLGGGPVSWSSQRQRIVTLSTTEAEYVAACEATKEAIWLRKLLNDINYPCVSPITLNVDNQSAINLVKNPQYHKRTKHIDTRYHFISEHYEKKDIEVQYTPSKSQLADIFTKPLARDRFYFLCTGLGLCSQPK